MYFISALFQLLKTSINSCIFNKRSQGHNVRKKTLCKIFKKGLFKLLFKTIVK